MDPISQGVVGAAAAQFPARRRQLATAGLLGAVAGMAPDLDVLMVSSTDPLFFLKYHRQFTHSFAFIPVGALLVTSAMYWLVKRRQVGFAKGYLYCLLGYGTHALLDACTSYGTQVFWPFSDERVAWNVLPIVDPLFTVPLLVLVIAAGRTDRRALAVAACCWALAYPTAGLVQRERAEAAGHRLAADRGDEPIALGGKPSFGNLLVWKIVYETATTYHVDAVRVGLGKPLIYPGDTAAKLVLERDFPWLDPSDQQYRDVERFRWFSMGAVAIDPLASHRIIDVRYSMVPNRIDYLWAIELDAAAGADGHARWVTSRDASAAQTSALWRMVTGSPSAFDE